MKLIAQVKLQPTEEQAESLKQTMIAANAAAQYVSDYAWEHRTFRQYDLHHACYYDVREKFGLSAQLTARVIAKVADSYKLDKRTKRTFRSMGGIVYDSRILKWDMAAETVSIWAMGGRIKLLPFVCGDQQRTLLADAKGECDLIFRDGAYYLHQTCDVAVPETVDAADWLGIDMGLVNVAVDSDGKTHDGAEMLNMRKRRRRQRKRLQAKGTKSAKRVLRNLSRKEQRFATNENHRISKEIVELAERTGRGVVVEDLHGIRSRVRLRRKQRDDLHSWSFHQLQGFIEYKCEIHGVPFLKIDPRYTSQTCSACGHVAKSNRKSQDRFECGCCGFAANADHNAAINISVLGRGAVSHPNGSSTRLVA